MVGNKVYLAVYSREVGQAKMIKIILAVLAMIASAILFGITVGDAAELFFTLEPVTKEVLTPIVYAAIIELLVFFSCFYGVVLPTGLELLMRNRNK